MKAAMTVRQRAPRTPDQHLFSAAMELLAAHLEHWSHEQRARGRVVTAARSAGLTWDQIADALGEKPDAVRMAHQRYLSRGEL